MASELIELKSKLLLPNQKAETEEDEEVDPREELVNRLLEYQAYKEITKCIKRKRRIKKRNIYQIPRKYKELCRRKFQNYHQISP